MENVVKYFQREIRKIEMRIATLDEKYSNTDKGCFFPRRPCDAIRRAIYYRGKTKELRSELVALQKLLDEALNAQRLLEASKRQ